MNYSNVKGHTDLVRDNSTRAIVSNDSSQYDNYLQRRAQRQQGKDRIDNMEYFVNGVDWWNTKVVPSDGTFYWKDSLLIVS